MSVLRDAAVRYAAHGWPVLPVQAGGKRPLTAHGVTDATTDPKRIGRWWRAWPDANIGLATGAPGPTVLDIDRPDAARQILESVDAPTVATAQGRHLYFHGTLERTVVLGYGELRGRGSYVVAPPSIHPSGREYVWLQAPGARLPAVPLIVTAGAVTAGTGAHTAPDGLIPHGDRHPYLRDFAVRLVRAGVTDPARLELHLWAEYEWKCELSPAPRPGSLRELARWAAGTRIAQREREGI